MPASRQGRHLLAWHENVAQPKPCFQFRDTGLCARGTLCQFSHAACVAASAAQPSVAQSVVAASAVPPASAGLSVLRPSPSRAKRQRKSPSLSLTAEVEEEEKAPAPASSIPPRTPVQDKGDAQPPVPTPPSARRRLRASAAPPQADVYKEDVEASLSAAKRRRAATVTLPAAAASSAGSLTAMALRPDSWAMLAMDDSDGDRPLSPLSPVRQQPPLSSL